MTDAGGVRVGSAEREQAVADLRRAAEDGRLTAAELDERTDRARAARTVTELAVLMADLRPTNVVVPTTAPAVPTAAAVLAALASAGQRPDAPLILNAGVNGAKRSGSWLVPPFLKADAGVATVRIDCLEAHASAEVVDLNVQAVAGTVVLVLPEGWAANVDRLGKGVGSIRVKVPGVPAPGCPLFVVHGSVGMGTFVARPGNRFERWRLRRRQARHVL